MILRVEMCRFGGWGREGWGASVAIESCLWASSRRVAGHSRKPGVRHGKPWTGSSGLVLYSYTSYKSVAEVI